MGLTRFARQASNHPAPSATKINTIADPLPPRHPTLLLCPPADSRATIETEPSMNPLLTLPLNFQNLSSALNVLTSMLTPALLLSAAASLIISTSARLGRVVDRVRKLSDRLEELMDAPADSVLIEERRNIISAHMEKQSRRASLLMRALISFYLAGGAFVLTSLSIGLVSIFSSRWYVLPVVLGVLGAVLLLVGSLRLIAEARLALEGLQEETAFLQRLAAARIKR